MMPAPRAARAGCRRTRRRRRRARRHAVGRGSRRRRRSRFRCGPLGYGAAPLSRAPLPAPLASSRSVLGLFGFTSRAITLAWGTSSDSSSSRLGISSTARMLTPVRLPPGRARLATKPFATGSPPPAKTIGIVEVAFFAASAEGGPPLVDDHVDLAADEVGGQCGQPIIAGPPPSGIRSPRFVPRHSRFRSVPGGTRPQTVHTGRATGAEEADHRHRLLLRASGGPPNCCAAEQGNEAPPLHLILLKPNHPKPYHIAIR